MNENVLTSLVPQGTEMADDYTEYDKACRTTGGRHGYRACLGWSNQAEINGKCDKQKLLQYLTMCRCVQLNYSRVQDMQRVIQTCAQVSKISMAGGEVERERKKKPDYS